MRFEWMFAALIFATPVVAQPYFGAFGDGPSGEFKEGDPWQEFVLNNDFVFMDPNGLEWKTPKGSVVNGASIPPMFWSFIGSPFTGNYLKASVVHDYFVETRTRTAHDTHRNFYYGMRANGVPSWQAKTMYWAVRTFGADWDLKAPPKGQFDVVKADFNQVILNDIGAVPAELAQQSLLEVARNLKTSEGDILRARFEGGVDATLDAIDADALQTQNALAWASLFLTADIDESQKANLLDFSGLSDFSGAGSVTFETLPVWPDGVIPLSGGALAQDFRATVGDGTADFFKEVGESPG